MQKNKIQFQKCLNFPEFLNSYGTEEQCVKALSARCHGLFTVHPSQKNKFVT